MGVTDKFFLLGRDFLLDDLHGFFTGDDEKVYRSTPINNRFGKPPDRIDDNGFVSEIQGISGIHNPAADGINHLYATHTHGGIFIADSPV